MSVSGAHKVASGQSHSLSVSLCVLVGASVVSSRCVSQVWVSHTLLFATMTLLQTQHAPACTTVYYTVCRCGSNIWLIVE